MSPFYGRLLDLLLVAPWRVNAEGELTLTEAEAGMLRACDFNAAPGRWKIPGLRPDLVRLYRLPAHLADGWTPPPSVSRPPSISRVPFPSRPAASSSPPAVQPLPDLLRCWLRSTATPDDRRLLTALVKRSAPVAQRRLQQALHRVRAHRFHTALDRLLALGLIVRDGRHLTLVPRAREPLLALGIGVSRPPQVRTLTTGRRQRRRKVLWYRDRQGQLRPLPAFANGRRTLPPVGTSAWGRSMLAKRGGYARQRQCRALGICPTAEATVSRQAHVELAHRSPI